MIQDKFGQLVFSEDDVCDLLMQGQELSIFDRMIVDRAIDMDNAKLILENVPTFISYDQYAQDNLSVDDFDHRCQSHWYMPQEYQHLDIAEYILGLCNTEAELQRVGEELLLFQERDLFELLKYLKYLVDTLTANNVIWGVGRGSSVSSYVLYLLGVHRIDSMFYDLDPREFLR